MKKFLLAICLVMATVMMVTPAFATELWETHLRGTDEGLAAGALPPAGFYFINDFYFVPSNVGYGPALAGPNYTSGQNNSAVKLFAYIDVPILLWVPGCCFLGAQYGVAIAQPFDYTNLRVQTGYGNPFTGATNSFVGGDQWGAFNTIILPYILSWNIPCDFHVKTSLAVAIDDPTTSPRDRVGQVDPFTGQKYAWTGGGRLATDGGIYAESGNGYYSFTPEIGLSWLHGGWNVSAELYYSFNMENDTTNYLSGEQFSADYTATYTCGKWTFGVGAAQQNQVTNDKFVVPVGYYTANNLPNVNGVGVFGPANGLYQSRPNTEFYNYSAGPVVGYNFGPCSLQFWYDFPIGTNNCFGGDRFNMRLVVPLGKVCGY